MKLNFYLNKGTYLSLRIFDCGFIFQKSLQKVDASLWNKETQRLNETKSIPYQELNSFLDMLSSEAKEHYFILKKQHGHKSDILRKELKLFVNEKLQVISPKRQRAVPAMERQRAVTSEIDFTQIHKNINSGFVAYGIIRQCQKNNITCLDDIDKGTISDLCLYVENYYNFNVDKTERYQSSIKVFFYGILAKNRQLDKILFEEPKQDFLQGIM